MNAFEIIGYPLFLLAALEVVLGLILLRHNPRNSPVNRSVAFFSIFSSVFSLLTAIMYLRASEGLDFLFFARATWVAWFCIPPALQFIFYLRDEKSRIAPVVGAVLYPLMTAILVISIATDWIVAGPYTLIPYVYHAGPLDKPARFLDGSLILWLIIEIYRLRRQVTGTRRAQLDYFFFGTLIFAGGGSLTGAFLQLFGNISFDPTLASYFSFPWVVLTFYAITRHRLFDIPLMMSKTIGIVLLLVFFESLHLGLDRAFEQALGVVASDILTLTIIGVIFFATPLAQRVTGWTNSILLKGRYDYQNVLRETTKAIITILDRDLLLNTIIESIRRSLSVEIIHYCIKPHPSLPPAAPDADQHGMCTIDNDLMTALQQAREIVFREELGTSDVAEDVRLHAAMARINAELIIPLLYKGDVLGYLALGPKGNGRPYVQSDLDLLRALAGHAAVAIENARLYEEARRMKASLQESEQKFRTLAMTMKAGIAIYRDDRFLYINPATETITGYGQDEFLAMKFSDIIHPDHADLVRDRSIARRMGKNVPAQYEFKIIRKGGEERWIMATAGQIDYEGEPAAIAALFDITDYKRTEEERARLYEENVRHYRGRIEEEQRHQQEKEKILMDIHDGIGGITTNISLLAEVAKKASSPEEVNRTLSTISNLSRDGLLEIRNLMHSLDARELDWHTLIAELRNQGTSALESHKISFDMNTEMAQNPGRPGGLLYLNLFRIYREALTNVIKHAGASKVAVHFRVAQKSPRPYGAGRRLRPERQRFARHRPGALQHAGPGRGNRRDGFHRHDQGRLRPRRDPADRELLRQGHRPGIAPAGPGRAGQFPFDNQR